MWTSTDQVLGTSWSACSRVVSAEPIFTSSTPNYQDRRSRLFPATRSSVALNALAIRSRRSRLVTASDSWLGWSCGECEFCRAARENLCRAARYTGYHINGGYAEYAVADARFCFLLPATYDDNHAAPLLCAGLIGYRAYRMAGPGPRLGIYGFGAAAHVITQVAVHQGRDVYAFVSPGDDQALRFAREVGATWAGPSNEPPPVLSTAR